MKKPRHIMIYFDMSTIVRAQSAAPGRHVPTVPTVTGNAALLSPPACGKPQLTTLPSLRKAAKAAPKDHLPKASPRRRSHDDHG